MAAGSKLMIVEAKRRLPCRIKLGIQIGGFGESFTEVHAWLDQNYGAAGWAMTPARLRSVVNDAVSIYFLDATLAAFRNEMVRRVERRNQRRGVPSAGGSASAEVMWRGRIRRFGSQEAMTAFAREVIPHCRLSA